MPNPKKEGFLSDAAIIRRIRIGDQAAEKLLLEKYWRQLLALCLAMGTSEADTEEVVNDVFLTALTCAQEGKLGANVGPWLKKITRYRVIDRWRHNRTVWEHDTEVAKEFSYLVQEQEETKEEVHSFEKFIMQKALKEMEDKDAKILGWIGNHVTNKELAEYLNVNENAARQARMRAIRKLKQKYVFLRERAEKK